MIHTVRLLSEPLSEEERKIIANKNKPQKTPASEVDKLELDRKIQDNLYHLGDLYIPILNEKLHSVVGEGFIDSGIWFSPEAVRR